MNRTYLLPVMSAVSVLGSACGSSIDGTWDLTRVVADGETYNYPLTYADDTYSYSYSFQMEIDKDETASLTSTYTYSVVGEAPEVDTYTYNGAWTKGEDKTWEITFPEMDLSLSCTKEDGDLDCDDGDGAQIIFSPAE